MIQCYENKSGDRVRERLLAYGPPESAKSTALLRIAKWYLDTETPGHFYVISTDLGYEALLTDPEFEELEGNNLTLRQVEDEDMQGFVDAGQEFKSKGGRDDWLSIDLMGDAWKAASDEYANLSTKGKIGDIGALWKKSGKPDEYPVTGWEWGMPNARYRYLLNNCVRAFPGHVFCVGGQKELITQSSSGKTREAELVKTTFGHIGYKPDTKAEDEAYRFHSILYFSGSRARGFRLTTAKERFKYRRMMGKEMTNGSGQWVGETYEDFFMDYLVLNAKWKV